MEATFVLGVLLTTLLAYANGSNDVSKAIATLVGSGVTSYRRAILWGSVWTTVGSLLAAVFAWQMVKTFTTGWLAIGVRLDPWFPLAVLLGAVSWVLIASYTGLPVSTTHAITGALCGTGLLAYGAGAILWSSLLGRIFLPLLASPLLALALIFVLFPLIKRTLAGRSGYCLCVGIRKDAPVPVNLSPGSLGVLQPDGTAYPEAVLAPRESCGRDFTYSLDFNLNTLHWLSSGAASFARGLNDAPKIAALLATLTLVSRYPITPMGNFYYFALIAAAMGLGSYLYGLRVTKVLAERVTAMDHLEGFAANLTTAILVSTSAHWGWPVSTTHVSASAIMAVGLRKGVRSVCWPTVRHMALAWMVTLPAAGLFAAVGYGFLHRLFK